MGNHGRRTIMYILALPGDDDGKEERNMQWNAPLLTAHDLLRKDAEFALITCS